mgnify:CR=1 FL=1
MNTNLKNIIAVSILSAFSGSAMAQNTNSGYFLDGYLYRHEMNPAFDNERNYVSFHQRKEIAAASICGSGSFKQTERADPWRHICSAGRWTAVPSYADPL